MQVIQQNEATAADRRVYFRLCSTSDGSDVTGASVTVRIAKNGTDAAGSGSVTEVDASDQPGLYYYEATTGEVDTLGTLLITPSTSGAYTFTYPVAIVEYDPFAAPDDADDVAGAVATELGTGSGLTALATASALSTVDSVLDGLVADIGSNGSGLTALPWNSAWDTEVQSEVTDALNAYDPPTRAELTSDIQGLDGKIDTIDANVDAILVDTSTTLDGKLNTIDGIVDEILVDTSTTIPAAISSAAAPTAGDVANAVWDEAQAGHTSAGTFGAFLDSAVSGVSTGGVSASEIADAVWDEALAGHADAGSAGATLSGAGSGADAGSIADAVRTELTTELGRIDAAVSSRATPANVTSAQSAITDAISGLNDLSSSDVQSALDAQGLTSAVVTALRVAALLSAGDWTRSNDTITLSDGTTLALTVTDGVVTGLDVTVA